MAHGAQRPPQSPEHCGNGTHQNASQASPPPHVARGITVNVRAELCSGENVAGGLRSQNVVDPLVEERWVLAGLYARSFVLGERDPCAREQP